MHLQCAKLSITYPFSRPFFLCRLQGILTMRDFLIEKLKSAEIALKSVMIENAAFRKQSSADQEVCVLQTRHHMPCNIPYKQDIICPDQCSLITILSPIHPLIYTTSITSHALEIDHDRYSLHTTKKQRLVHNWIFYITHINVYYPYSFAVFCCYRIFLVFLPIFLLIFRSLIISIYVVKIWIVTIPSYLLELNNYKLHIIYNVGHIHIRNINYKWIQNSTNRNVKIWNEFLIQTKPYW